jgi:hypothetical protein
MTSAVLRYQQADEGVGRGSGEPPYDLLQRFLSCSDGKQSNSLLERLLSDAAPMIRRIVLSKVPKTASEDVQHDVLTDLIARLQHMKRSGAWDSIADFNAYSAVAAFHGCRQHYRRSFPERHRLGTRVRYLLARHPRFAIWKTSGGTWMCGRRERPREAGATVRAPSKETERMVERILEESDAPLTFEDLLAHLFSAQQTGLSVTQPEASVETRLTQRDWIRKLWSEIGQLPLPQRISLLLSMRDEDGNSGLILFPMVGVASLRQIATGLAMPAEDLARIWGCLPLNDQRIGEHLRLDRQRVINLRKSARERLSRRARPGTKVEMNLDSAR